MAATEDLIPKKVTVHDPRKGTYQATRWVRPKASSSGAGKQGKGDWLARFLAESDARRKRKERWAAHAIKAAKDAQVFRLEYAGKDQSRETRYWWVVHPSLHPGVTWQATYFTADGKPAGHFGFKSKENAIQSICGLSTPEGPPVGFSDGEYKVTEVAKVKNMRKALATIRGMMAKASKQPGKRAGLVPTKVVVHDPRKGTYQATRWVRPLEEVSGKGSGKDIPDREGLPKPMTEPDLRRFVGFLNRVTAPFPGAKSVQVAIGPNRESTISFTSEGQMLVSSLRDPVGAAQDIYGSLLSIGKYKRWKASLIPLLYRAYRKGLNITVGISPRDLRKLVKMVKEEYFGKTYEQMPLKDRAVRVLLIANERGRLILQRNSTFQMHKSSMPRVMQRFPRTPFYVMTGLMSEALARAQERALRNGKSLVAFTERYEQIEKEFKALQDSGLVKELKYQWRTTEAGRAQARLHKDRDVGPKVPTVREAEKVAAKFKKWLSRSLKGAEVTTRVEKSDDAVKVHVEVDFQGKHHKLGYARFGKREFLPMSSEWKYEDILGRMADFWNW